MNSHQEDLQHQEKMNVLVEEAELNLIKILNPTISMDGNQWCVLWGKDLMEGVAGFGDTPRRACADFVKNFNAKTIQLTGKETSNGNA